MSNKKLLAVFGVLLVTVAASVYFFPKCEQPTEMKVVLTQLQCAREIITPELADEACHLLGRESECEFVEEDRQVIIDLIGKRVNDCTKKSLEADNYCTDQVKDLL